ncbi:class I adenylate-forming enzyme family protein [Nocardia sp. NPDC051321]|uniref:class I adenylate-forming enzyme family protein n=1 Tax=Nocardia sp. NPDC051321 TaxID=3364323 RepID=UPI00378F1621
MRIQETSAHIATTPQELADQLRQALPTNGRRLRQLERRRMTTTAENETTTIGFLLGAFEERSAQVALTFAGGEWTYGQLLDRTNRMARVLAGQGLKRGDVVALATGADPHTFALKFAANALGCAVCILYDDLGPSLLGDILRYIEPAAVVVIPGRDDDRVIAAAEQVPGATVLALGNAVAVDLAQLADAESGAPITVQARPADLSAIRLTGGSTGVPKGIPHDSALPDYYSPTALRMWQTTQLLCTAIGHLGGSLAEAVLAAGGRVVLQEGNQFDPGRVLEAIAREQVRFLWMQPAMLHQLLDHPGLDTADTSSLRFMAVTGGPTTPERIAQAVQRFGPIISTGYGTYEIGQIALLGPAEHQRPELLTTVGRPVPGVRVSIRGTDAEELKPGETGEIWVRGPGLTTGYYKLPELTADAIRDGWFRTGDLGFLDADGYLSVVGRTKDAIIGVKETVYPAQIEQVLHRHPAIAHAVVFGVTDGLVRDEKIAAAVVLRPPLRLSEAEVTAWIRTEMGGAYAPELVLILAELPTTGSNKPDRAQLRDLAADRLKNAAT